MRLPAKMSRLVTDFHSNGLGPPRASFRTRMWKVTSGTSVGVIGLLSIQAVAFTRLLSSQVASRHSGAGGGLDVNARFDGVGIGADRVRRLDQRFGVAFRQARHIDVECGGNTKATLGTRADADGRRDG